MKKHLLIIALALVMAVPLATAYAYYWDGIKFFVWRELPGKGAVLTEVSCPQNTTQNNIPLLGGITPYAYSAYRFNPCQVTCQAWAGIAKGPIYGQITTRSMYKTDFSSLPIGQFPNPGPVISRIIDGFGEVQFCVARLITPPIPTSGPAAPISGSGQIHTGTVSFQITDLQGANVVITAQGGTSPGAPYITCSGTIYPPLSLGASSSTLNATCSGINQPPHGVVGGFVGTANCGTTYNLISSGSAPGDVAGVFTEVSEAEYLSPCGGSGTATVMPIP